jgi:UDPglucose--hexose-1-phosphate uridylyltransferase
MSDSYWQQHPHRRFNPLTREWVLVSPQRNQRPWLGQVETPAGENPPSYDPHCYMCPGNLRAAGARNPHYETTLVFDNDYPALLPPRHAQETPLGTTPACSLEEDGLVVAESEAGICRVVCFSPRHDLTLATMTLPEIGGVVDVWTEQYRELSALPFIQYVQIFENRGAAMGASNPHPHCQIWASSHLPNEPAKEQRAQEEYRSAHGSCLLCDYLARECRHGERLVLEDRHFTALVPFWAVWPFETLVIAREHRGALSDLSGEERDALAAILKQLTTRYDSLFNVSFPYSMGIHQSPAAERPHPEWHLHLHFYPPLLRSATIRKFMVGYEMLGTPQRDLTAEVAAARLRACKT